MCREIIKYVFKKYEVNTLVKKDKDSALETDLVHSLKWIIYLWTVSQHCLILLLHKIA